MGAQGARLAGLLKDAREALLSEWIDESRAARGEKGSARLEHARAVLVCLEQGIAADGDPQQFDGPAWEGLRHALAEASASDAAQGREAGETNRFILALKPPVFVRLQQQLGKDTDNLMASVLWASGLVDAMAQFTASAYQQSREDMILRQQQELLELSTPVIKLWDGVLAVPMIGTLDSGRSQLVMETLLQRIVDTGSRLAIIDITGVPTVDTLVAQHLLKTVSAIRLMGAECIISGIRPQIAQTIVHLGIDLQGIASKASLSDALQLALEQQGMTITRTR
jgi:rsbT co-antagonist protein RsbR